MKNPVVRITTLAVFVGIMLLLYLTPLGLIHIPPINLTLYCIPVLVGTLVLGLRDGWVLGLCFGILSTVGAFTAPSASVALLMEAQPYAPALVVVMSIIPRLLIPTAAYYVGKWTEGKRFGLPLAAVCGSLTNTIFYLGALVGFYALCGLDNSAIVGGILGVTGLGACGEMVLNGVVVPPIVLALRRVSNKFRR